MRGPDVIKLPLGVAIGTFALLIGGVVWRAVTVPYGVEAGAIPDMPLGQWIDGLFVPVAAGIMVWIVAACVGAVMLASAVVRYGVSPVRTYLPIVMYGVTVCTPYFPLTTASGALLQLLLVSASVRMVDAFKRSYQFENVFKAAFYIGIMPMLYSQAICIVPVILVALVVYGRTLREAAVALVGVLTPFVLCSVVWWWLGEPLAYTVGCMADAFGTFAETPAWTMVDAPLWIQIYTGLLGLSLLFALFLLTGSLASLRTRARQVYIYCIWLILFTAIPVVMGECSVFMPLLGIPLCVIVSSTFMHGRGWLYAAVYILLVVAAFAVNILPVFAEGV